MIRSFLSAFLLLWLLTPSLASASQQDDSAQKAFRDGIAAFLAKEYDRAQAHLESARKQGLNTFALHYNLGVLYYETGQYERSREAFGTLLSTRHATLARYNLGLIALAENEPSQAAALFREVAESDKEKLAGLAQRQLERMEGTEAPAEERPPIQLYASLGAGYEDNFSLEPDGSPNEESGAAVELVVAASGYLRGDRASGLRLGGSHFQVRYPGESDFDRHVTQMSVDLDRQVDDVWWLRGSIGQAWIYEDSNRVERQSPFSVTGVAEACGPLQLGRYCRLELEYVDIAASNAFEGYDGHQHNLSVRHGWGERPWWWTLDYRLTNDERSDLELGSEFFSLSAWRHRVRLTLDHPINDRLTVSADVGGRWSFYKDDHRVFDDGVLKEEIRRDRRLGAGLEARYRWIGDWRLFAEMRYRHNHSSLSRYSYDYAALMAGIERRW